MTSFSIASSITGETGGFFDFATVTLPSVTVGNGNILFAVLSSQQDLSHTTHSVSGGGGAWTKLYGFDSFSDPDTATAFGQVQSVWWRRALPTDPASLSITGSIPGEQSGLRLSVVQIAPASAYSAEFADFSAATSGPVHWDGLNSGDTSNISASDLLVIGVGTGSLGFTAPTSIAFTPAKDNNLVQLTLPFEIIGFDTAGQGPGVKSATISSDGGGIFPVNGICGVVVFQPAAVTGTGVVELGAAEVSGTGSAVASTGTGDIDIAATEVNGAGLVSDLITGTGAINFEPAQVDGVGQRAATGTGAIDIAATQVSGVGLIAEVITGTGVTIVPPAEVSGAGFIAQSIGSGDITFRAVTVNGFGEPNLGRVHRGAGKAKQYGRITGPQRLRERTRKRKEKEAELERLAAEAMAERLRIENDAIAMLLLS